MLPVLTAEDVRRQDAEAEARGVSIEQLMESAGWAVARTAREMLGGTYGRRVVVACGKGNNGGDGLVAARRLMQMGAHVAVIGVFDPSTLKSPAKENLERFRGQVLPVAALAREIERADLVVDAIFGVGLSRAPEGEAATAIASLGSARAPVLSVDVPSGVDGDTGAVAGACVRADVTTTFGGYKPGLLFMPGLRHAGRVIVADIGTTGRSAAVALGPSSFAASWPPLRTPGQHKRSSGVVLVVAGSLAMPGAAALSTAAAVHAGAGLTTLCAPRETCALALARTPEMTTIPYEAGAEGVLDQKAVAAVLERLDGFDAIAIGPGVSAHPATVQAVRSLVAATDKPVILDADGINAFAGAAGLLRQREPNTTILTPHAGELARLVGVPTAELEGDRLAGARRIARDLRCVLVFKGPGTVTAARAGSDLERTQIFVNTTGGAALAQGGTGDVLTGIVAAAIGQAHAGRRSDASRHDANAALAAAAVWLHGRAADRIAARLWPHPANASALIEEIGPTLHDVMSS